MNASKTKPLSPQLTTGASFLFVFFWATGFVSAKYGFPYAEPLTFLAMRFAIAIVVMGSLCLFVRASWPQSLSEAAHVLVSGWLVQTSYLIGVWYGIWLGVDTGVVALIVGLQPLLTGIISAFLLSERVSRTQWIGLSLGFLGLASVVFEKINPTGSQSLGGLFCLGALITITVGTLYQKKFCSSVDIRTAVTLQNGGSLLLVLPLAFVFESRAVIWSGDFLFALIWSAVGLSVIAIALLFLLIRNGAATKVTSMIYLSPPTTALMGWVLFDEKFSILALVGLGATVLGVALASRE